MEQIPSYGLAKGFLGRMKEDKPMFVHPFVHYVPKLHNPCGIVMEMNYHVFARCSTVTK